MRMRNQINNDITLHILRNIAVAVPQTYEQWRHCITVECALALTPAFVKERLGVWRNAKAEETTRFRQRYGDVHWQAVVGWFEQAERSMA